MGTGNENTTKCIRQEGQCVFPFIVNGGNSDSNSVSVIVGQWRTEATN